MQRELVTAVEAGKLLKLSRATVIGYARRGAIPYIKPGKRYLFDMDSVIETLKGNADGKPVEAASSSNADGVQCGCGQTADPQG